MRFFIVFPPLFYFIRLPAETLFSVAVFVGCAFCPCFLLILYCLAPDTVLFSVKHMIRFRLWIRASIVVVSSTSHVLMIDAISISSAVMCIVAWATGTYSINGKCHSTLVFLYWLSVISNLHCLTRYYCGVVVLYFIHSIFKSSR